MQSIQELQSETVKIQKTIIILLKNSNKNKMKINKSSNLIWLNHWNRRKNRKTVWVRDCIFQVMQTTAKIMRKLKGNWSPLRIFKLTGKVEYSLRTLNTNKWIKSITINIHYRLKMILMIILRFQLISSKIKIKIQFKEQVWIF